jgi:hypothetical protein
MCLPCPNNCTNCTSETVCDKCVANAELNSSSLCVCDNHSFLGNDNNSCKHCQQNEAHFSLCVRC